MTAADYPLGAVGLSTYGRVFHTEHGWLFDDGSGHCKDADKVSGFRPLVVIDPEDREQVERLAAANADTSAVKVPWSERGDTNRAIAVSGVQTALREFANPTPTRPEEPTGLGAVVEDAAGKPWIRVMAHDMNGPKPWAPLGNVAFLAGWRSYADIDAVRVLSEGVQP